jgi:hypothetical protein
MRQQSIKNTQQPTKPMSAVVEGGIREEKQRGWNVSEGLLPIDGMENYVMQKIDQKVFHSRSRQPPIK